MKLLLSFALAVSAGLVSLASQDQESTEPAPRTERDWRELQVSDEVTLRYMIHTPPEFNPETTHPLLLVFPPGDQSRELATWIVDYFSKLADRDGWVLVSPIAVNDMNWYGGLEEFMPQLFASLEEEYAIEYGALHVAGISNGGRSAFRVAGLYPEFVHSLTALPGMPASDGDWERLQDIAHLPISLFVGSEDEGWVEAARRAESELGNMGAPDLSLTIVPGGGHVLGEEVASSVFDRLERSRARTEREEEARSLVDEVLDSLHDAAAKADEKRYFGHFAPAATFVGTDALERWSLGEFKAFALPYFQEESAWTYVPFERHITFSSNFKTAWFDEKLRNEKYGETRGSGVLVEQSGRWRLAHYVLSFPIPNEVAPKVVELVKEATK